MHSLLLLAAHGLRTVEGCKVVTSELVSRPGFDTKEKRGLVSHLGFSLRFMLVLIAIAILSGILAILHCISVFAVSTAFEHLPTSHILIGPI